MNATLVRDAAGVPQHVLLQVQDVTERRRYETELRYLADHDPLTGLLNRRAFARELESHLEHVRRYGPAGAAMVLDLDHFKNINDTLGHGTGDELIVSLADALRGGLGDRVGDRPPGRRRARRAAARRRRDDVDAAAELVLDSVRGQRVASPSGRLRSVSASIGIAGFDEDGPERRRRARQRRPRDVRGQGRPAATARSPTGPPGAPRAASTAACRGRTSSATGSTRTASCCRRSRS